LQFRCEGFLHTQSLYLLSSRTGTLTVTTVSTPRGALCRHTFGLATCFVFTRSARRTRATLRGVRNATKVFEITRGRAGPASSPPPHRERWRNQRYYPRIQN